MKTHVCVQLPPVHIVKGGHAVICLPVSKPAWTCPNVHWNMPGTTFYDTNISALSTLKILFKKEDFAVILIGCIHVYVVLLPQQLHLSRIQASLSITYVCFFFLLTMFMLVLVHWEFRMWIIRAGWIVVLTFKLVFKAKMNSVTFI